MDKAGRGGYLFYLITRREVSLKSHICKDNILVIQTKNCLSLSEYFKGKENVVLENRTACGSIMQSEWAGEVRIWAAPSPMMSHSSLGPLHAFHLKNQSLSEISKIAYFQHKPPNGRTGQTIFAYRSIADRFPAVRKSQPIQSLHFCNLQECFESVYGSFTQFS